MISICLLFDIRIFEKKLIIINRHKISLEIKKLCEISKFKLLNISKVSALWNNKGAVITREPFKKYTKSWFDL